MRQTVITCDRCHKTIKGKTFKVQIDRCLSVNPFENYGKYDFCESCIADIQHAIKDCIDMTQDKVDECKIDDGKVMALWNAGWTLENIADEFRCSVKTIQKHIRLRNEVTHGEV